MMKKAMAIALLSTLCASASAREKSGQYQPDSIVISSDQVRVAHSGDTIFGSEAESPHLSYQNLVYKQRLDSIEQSVPLSYNEHVQNYIDIYAYKRKEQISKMLGLSTYYFPIFEKSLKEVGVPDELKFISVIESALNPHAVSRSGAVGPWQFMYTTAKGYGLVMNSYVDERKDPVEASYAAAVYLKDAYARLGDWLLAIAAYNCGTGAVSRAIARSGGEADFWKVRPFLPRETQNYVPAFIATVYAMNYFQKHDIIPQQPGFSMVTDVIDVNRTVSFSSIARAGEIDIEELQLLNPAYKKQVVNGTPAAPRRLVIPAIGKQNYAMLYDVLNSENDQQSPAVSASERSANSRSISVPVTHQVKEGQSLLMVANQYGVELQDLKVLNSLKSVEVVPGQIIRLKQQKPVVSQKRTVSSYITYIVKAGDTLSEIAEKFQGATVSRIKALNGLKKNTVQPGMKLKINKG